MKKRLLPVTLLWLFALVSACTFTPGGSGDSSSGSSEPPSESTSSPDPSSNSGSSGSSISSDISTSPYIPSFSSQQIEYTLDVANREAFEDAW